MARKESLGGARLTADAKNRAWRSLLIGLTIDMGLALVLGLVAAFDQATGWGDLQWGLIGFAVAKSAVQALGSFFLRRVVDPSSIPSPLPPADPGPPANTSDVPPNTAVEDEDADAEVTKKRADFDPDEPARLLQADIDLEQAQAANRRERVQKTVEARKSLPKVPRTAAVTQITKKAPIKKTPAKKAAPRKRASE